jgi:hypothetical protein
MELFRGLVEETAITESIAGQRLPQLLPDLELTWSWSLEL